MITARAWMILLGSLVAGPLFAAADVVHVPAADMETNRREMNALQQQLPERSYAFFLDKPELSVGQSSREFVTWDWKEDGVLVRFVQGGRTPIEFKFAAMPKIEVLFDSIFGTPFYGLRVREDLAIWCTTNAMGQRLVCGKWLGEAFAFFSARAAVIVKGRAEFEAKFQETVSRYPDPANRPELPEEARRFKVQAEVAVRDKRLTDALGYYSQAANVAPWWAEAYFNISLLYAEQKQYDSAIRNMKRYLILLPAAANARAAQDKIYEWESLPK